MMSGKEWLIYTGRLALRCMVAIVVVTVLFFLVAGFLAYPFSTGAAVVAFVVGMIGGVWWAKDITRGTKGWLHHHLERA